MGYGAANCVMHDGGATKGRVLADTQPKIVKNALAKQPFADFTAEQKRYKITLRVTLAQQKVVAPEHQLATRKTYKLNEGKN